MMPPVFFWDMRAATVQRAMPIYSWLATTYMYTLCLMHATYNAFNFTF